MTAIVLKDRVKETTSTAGTSDFVLGGASSGYQAFSVIGPNNFTYYCCFDNATGDWEVGYGQYTTTAGGTLVRTSVLSNSAATTSKIAFAAGPKDVFITYPAEKAIYEEDTGNVLIDGGPITVIGTGVTGYTTFSAALGELYGNVDSFAQMYAQNYNDGTNASGDFVVYRNDAVNDTGKFVDMGINSANYSSVDYPIFSAGSAYLFNDGGELFVGSATDDVVLFAGGVDTTDEAVRISAATKSVTTVADVNVGGALDVTGAAVFGSTVLLNADPTLALQASTKQYVDNAVSNGFHVHTPVLVATTGDLTATYNNGTAGVGATLTNSGTQVALSIDGVAMTVADRVLVWQQATGAQNGVYVVTTVGSGATNWVLTRASDADTYVAQSDTGLGGGDYFFVSSGATEGFSSFVCTNDGVIVFGTTAITFQLFSTVPSYNVTAPLNLTGNTLALTGTVAATNGGTGTSTVTTGDLLYGSGTNTWGKLAAGAAYRSLVMNAGGTQVEWNAVALNQSGAVSGSLGATNGGTGQNAYAVGDVLYSGTTNTLSRLAGNTTTTKKFLGQTGTGSASAAPSWQQPAATDITGLAASATTDTTNAANISSGTLPTARLSGSYTGITGVGTLTAGTWNGSVIGATYGGTGQSSYAVGDLLYASTTTAVSKLADVAVGNALISGGVGAAPSYGKIGLATHVSGTLPVANGGTGVTTSTGSGNVVLSTSPTLVTPVLGTPSSGTLTSCTGLPLTTGVTGVLPIANGGTNSTATATNGGVGYGTGTAHAYTAAGTAGQVIVSNGAAAPTWQELTLANLPGAWVKKSADCATTAALTINTAQTTIDGVTISATSRVLVKDQAAPAQNGIYTGVTTVTWVRTTDADTAAELAGATLAIEAGTVNGGSVWTTGFKASDTVGTTAMNWYIVYDGSTTVPATNGGTGQSSYAVGDLVYASTTTALSKLADVATGNALISGGVGVAPSYGKIGLTTHVSGTLPVANGGTGVTTSTGSGSVVLSTSPTLVTPVLGTPSSGTLTSCTGLPLTTGVTGTLPAANGGTGQSSYAVGDLVYASTTTALSKLADVATGNALISGGVGVAPSYGKIGLTTHVSGTLPVANGGTALSSAGAAGNMLLATSASAYSSVTMPTFGFRNRIINGAMVIDQRNAGASVTVNTAGDFFPVDRFTCSGQSTDGVFTAQQSSTAPAGFTKSVVCTVTTADASIGATQRYFIEQKIEGYNIADLGFGAAGAATVTISFWVRSSLTGTFGGAVSGGQFYPFSYTINAANTWEQKTVTLVGSTSGSWNTTNGTGIDITFTLGAGSTYKGTANAWTSSIILSVTGAVDLISTNGATFYITGVQLEKGSTATSFDYRPYGTELALCQRYYESDTYKLYIGNNAGNLLVGRLTYKIPKRIAVTLGLSSAGISGGYNPPTAQGASSVNGVDVERTGAEINFGWTANAEL